MACTCTTITAFALSCTPTIGGVQKIEISNSDDTYVEIQALPDTGGYTSAMTFDRQHNLKYWTSSISFDVGNGFNEANRTLVEALPCPSPRKVRLTMNSGHIVVFDEAYIKDASFSVSGSKTEAGSGTINIEAITQDAPTVTDPS